MAQESGGIVTYNTMKNVPKVADIVLGGGWPLTSGPGGQPGSLLLLLQHIFTRSY